MTNPIAHILLVGAFIALDAQEPYVPAAQTTVVRCDDGAVEISQDVVHVTCDGLNLRVPPSSIRNITLAPPQPKFVIPIFVGPGGAAGIPIGHRHAVRLAVLGHDGQEHVVSLRVNDDDLTTVLAALNQVTHLPVFSERPDDHLAAARVPQTIGLYRLPPRSREWRAQVEDLSPRSAAVTDAGDVVVVYESGRTVLWNPPTMTVVPLGDREEPTADRPCQRGVQVIGTHQRIAAVFRCGRVLVYDLDSRAVRAEVTVEHPHAAALNGVDDMLYWLEAGQLHRRSLSAQAANPPPTPLAERFDRMALSPRGDRLFCSRAWGAGGIGGTDLYVYALEQGRLSAPVRMSALKGYDAADIGIHPQGTRIATLAQSRRVTVRDVITVWDLQPVPKKMLEVSQAKGVNIAGNPVRYSADGSTLVISGRPALAIDAATVTPRCAVSEPLRSTARPNAEGLSAGIGYSGWELGDLPRVVVWDSATCQIRSTLHPEMELLRSSTASDASSQR